MRSWEGGRIKRLDAAVFRDAFRPGHPEGRVESFTKRDGLTSDAVRSIFQDRRDGSIWVGTDHGLDHFREPSFLSALPSQELRISASRRKRMAASGLAAVREEDCGSLLRRERPRGLPFLE
jgi:hypothetical protein